MQPIMNHVDVNMFGSLPLELYLVTKDKKYWYLGLPYADSQWKVPANAKPEEKEWAEKGYSWQTRLWIDDMYMITIVQTRAYKVTKDKKYIDRAAKEMVMYLDELQRPNGLFYHAPDERRKKIVGKIWHMLFCGTFVAYMYTLIMIVYYSREPGSRTGVADMVLWSNWGMTLQMHAYFIENIVLFIPFGLLFPLVFKNWMRWFTIPVGALISAAIEYTQLVTGRGYCQLDDFVTNTAGAAIGFFIYLILYAGWLVWKKIR